MDLSPSWISAGASLAGFGALLVTGAVAVGKLMFASKQDSARLAEAIAQMGRDNQEALQGVRDESRASLSKAVEDRRKDQEAMNLLIRSDMTERMQAETSKLAEAIRESKAERQAENKAIRDDIREIKGIILRPRTGDTTAIRREVIA